MAGKAEDAAAVYAALLEWVYLWRLSPDIKSPKDLSDGVKLWELLQNVDGLAFSPQNLPQRITNDDWLPKFENLEFLLTALMKDIPDTDLPADHSPDLEAIAKKAPTAEINTLLKLCFLAAARRREKKPPYAEFYTLSQEIIKMIIASVEKAPQSSPRPSPSPNGNFVESDVYLEERLNQTTAELIRLQAYVKDIEEASDGYRAERDGLKEELHGTQNDLEDSRLSLNAHVRTGKQQRDEILQLETLIAEHEIAIRSNGKLIEDLQKSNASLTVNETNVQELEDKIQELRVQNTNLKRTANTVEKYKEKLKLQADIQAENEQLKHETKQLQDYVAQLEAAKSDPRIESSLRELQKVVSAQEIQLRDSATEKQHLHVNIKALEETNQLLKTQATRDREEIEELQEKLAAASTSSSPTTPKAPNRDPDFERIQETTRELEISELKREIEMLKSRPTGSPDVVLLQQRFDQAVQEIEELRRESTDFYQDKLSLETLLTATTSGEQYSQHPASTRALTHHVGSLSAYQNLANSKRLLQEENDLLKRRQTQTQRDLADATSKISIIDKDELEAAEEVIKTNSAEVTDVRREIDALKQDHHETLADLDRHRELLGKARLDRNNARKLADDQAVNMQGTGKANDDVKASLAKIESKLESQADQSTSAELKKYVNDLSEKVVEARKKLLDRTQYVKAQAAVIRDQNARIDQLETTDHETLAKKLKENEASLHILNASLLRENTLIATAWYDLNTRLQQSTISVASASAARRDMPKGWLGRQRVGVEGRMGLGGGRRWA